MSATGVSPGLAPLLRVEHLTVCLGTERILDDVSFTIEPATITAIVGPNGSGKTTLLKALLGLVPHEGLITWAPGTSIGYVPQRFSLPEGMPLTVREFFLLKADRFWRPSPDFDSSCHLQLEGVGLSPGLLDRAVASLSSGQMQRLMLGWALVGHPDVLLFDEPTASVDVGFRETLYALLAGLRQTFRTTILFISHDLQIVWRYASRVLCLDRRLICQGSPDSVLNPDVLKSLFGDVTLYRHHHDMPRDPGA
jgi:zinc transport system ATP-binding protein